MRLLSKEQVQQAEACWLAAALCVYPNFAGKVSMDFVTELQRTKAGRTAILVSLDYLSKMVHFAMCWHDIGSQEVAQDLPVRNLCQAWSSY